MEGASVMRLFLAILFEEPVKDRLCEAMELIRRSTRTSRLTRRENLHLTLVFLGELREAGKVREAMEEIRTGPFPLEIRGLGRFQRNGGDLYWAGIEPSLPLQNLYLELKNALAVGETIQFCLWREGETLDITVELVEQYSLE